MEVIFWIVLLAFFIAEGIQHQLFVELWHQRHSFDRATVFQVVRNHIRLLGIDVALVLAVFFSFNFAQALLGIILLIRGADVLIDGAEVVAEKANIPPIIIGILIIGLGTSSPEFFVNVISALKGDTDIAFGNIVGSNLSNMGLVIGIAGCIAGRIKIQRSIITAEMPVLIASTLLLIFQVLDFPPFTANASDAVLSVQDGMVMLLGLCMYLLYTFHTIANVPPNPEVQDQYQTQYGKAEEMRTWFKAIGGIVLGIAALYLGGDFTVTGATNIAVGLGAGTLVVGVIIGVGTSLPELAAAISSVLKNKPDLVVGNVVGSNIFNILLILGATAVIEPIALDRAIVGHLIFLFLVTGIFFLALGTKKELSRFEAIMLTILGIGYLAYSFFTGGT
jgi:cation:H+ antiporter